MATRGMLPSEERSQLNLLFLNYSDRQDGRLAEDEPNPEMRECLGIFDRVVGGTIPFS
jgi:hypothetical protein